MRRMTALTALAGAVSLAACDSGEIAMKNASVGEVAAEMRDKRTASFVNPGRWEQTATLVSIDAPGMPPEARAMMNKAFGESQVHDTCLTPEQARNPREEFFAGADKNCRYDHFNWGDGKIDLKLNCKHPQATQTMAMIGSYSPDAYSMTMTATNHGGGPADQMVMKMRVDAKRVGECTPEQAREAAAAAKQATEGVGGQP